MKLSINFLRTLAVFVCVVLCADLLAVGSDAAVKVSSLFITEVCFDPCYEYGTTIVKRDNDLFEYIELMNISAEPADLSGATLSVRCGTVGSRAEILFEAENDAVMAPGEIWVIGVFTPDAKEWGFSYSTVEKLNRYWSVFERLYSAAIPASRRALAVCEGGLFLPNSGASAELLVSTPGGVSARVGYSPSKQSANGLAVQYSLFDGLSYSVGNAGCSPGEVFGFQINPFAAHSPPTGEEVKLVEFNLCFRRTGVPVTGRAGDYSVEKRSERLSEYLSSVDADILCLSEVSEEWAQKLSSLGSEYRIIGESCYGEKNGRGVNAYDTYNPILYKNEKYTLLDCGTVWLRGDAPSIGNKTATFALFMSRKSSRRFCVISTHLSADGSGGNYENRASEAKYLSEKTSMLSLSNAPVILCGDFNFNEGTVLYHSFLSASGLSDAKYRAVNMLSCPTFNYWGKWPGEKGMILDYCFVSSGVGVECYEVMSDTAADGYLISDHNALELTVRI